MEGNPQTSFIPKKPLVEGANYKPPHTTNFFSLICTIIFVTAVALGGAVFAYKIYVTRAIASFQSELKTEVSKFDPELLANLTKLDSRLESGLTLLNEHTVLGNFFDFLGSATLSTVRFSSFLYQLSSAGGIDVVMTGEAKSFSDIALQLAEFMDQENQKVLKDPAFSNLNLDKSGNIVFTFKAKIVPSSILYKGTIDQMPSVPEQIPVLIPPSEEQATTTIQ